VDFAEIWDRGFWALLWFLFVTFVWLGLVDAALGYAPFGFLAALAVAAAYFGSWFVRERRLRKALQVQPRNGH
jgi:hypothetical protein